MDTKTLFAILIPSVLSVALAIINTVSSYRRNKARKEEAAWNTATQMTLSAIEHDNNVYVAPKDAKERIMYFDYAYRALRSIASEDVPALKQQYQETPTDQEFFARGQ